MSLAALSQVEPALRPITVDEELLARIYRAEALDTQDISQSWTAYLGHLIETAVSALFESLGGALDLLFGDSGISRALAFAVLAIAAVLLLLGLARWLLASRRRRSHPEAPVEPASIVARGRQGAAAWREELSRRLAAGERRAALEAAWWWFASSLMGERVDPAWTTRELMAASGRRDLAPPGRRLDVMLYSDEKLEAGELESWVRDVEPKLSS